MSERTFLRFLAHALAAATAACPAEGEGPPGLARLGRAAVLSGNEEREPAPERAPEPCAHADKQRAPNPLRPRPRPVPRLPRPAPRAHADLDRPRAQGLRQLLAQQRAAALHRAPRLHPRPRDGRPVVLRLRPRRPRLLAVRAREEERRDWDHLLAEADDLAARGGHYHHHRRRLPHHHGLHRRPRLLVLPQQQQRPEEHREPHNIQHREPAQPPVRAARAGLGRGLHAEALADAAEERGVGAGLARALVRRDPRQQLLPLLQQPVPMLRSSAQHRHLRPRMLQLLGLPLELPLRLVVEVGGLPLRLLPQTHRVLLRLLQDPPHLLPDLPLQLRPQVQQDLVQLVDLLLLLAHVPRQLLHSPPQPRHLVAPPRAPCCTCALCFLSLPLRPLLLQLLSLLLQ
eukprot:81891-Rhodomonas_salina.2